MESFFEVSQRGSCCPMLCILKTVLFAVVVVFMLFLPLGDPQVACQSVDTHNTKKVMCYLCEGYFFIAKLTDKTIQTMEFVLCTVINLMHETKLKLYGLLERMDRLDLCTSVCCISDDDVNSEECKAVRCPHCKCIRRKCNRKPKASCQYAQL